MKPLIVVPHYIRWHYSQAPKNIFHITKNLVWFLWHFFSIAILAATLFAPWQKIHEERPRGIDLGPILSTFIINILMRIVGGCIRIFMIVLGLSTVLLTILGAFVFSLVWLAFPLCIVFFVVLGFIIVCRIR